MFSDAEFAKRFLEALGRVRARPRSTYSVVVESGATGLPRASSIGRCARQQYFKLTDAPVTDETDITTEWSSRMGFAGQEIAGDVLREMGYDVQEEGLVQSDIMSGHLDGVIAGLDLDKPAVWDSKVRSAVRFRMLVQGKDDIKSADPEMYYQMQFYMQMMELDTAIITLHPHDVRATMRELEWRKVEVASPLVQRLVIKADPEAQQLVADRAAALITAKKLGLMVYREYNPADPKDFQFPCGWCEYRTLCMDADIRTITGEGMYLVPPLRKEES